MTNIVKLTQQVSGVSTGQGSLTITTEQSVGGGGSRNLIVWALLASQKGYNKVQIVAPYTNLAARDSLIKSVEYANMLLNNHGMTITVTFKKEEV